MRGKYITTDIRLACLSKPSRTKKDIYSQIAETLAERKQIMQQLERFVQTGRVVQMILTNSKAA